MTDDNTPSNLSPYALQPCLICKGIDFEWGRMATGASETLRYYKWRKGFGFPRAEAVTARTCKTCGNVFVFKNLK